MAARNRYVILKLQDAKRLAAAARGYGPELAPVISRIDAETGADMEEIADALKHQHMCHACVVEGQQRYCLSLSANKLGRRLWRLIHRAAPELRKGIGP